MNDEDRVDPLKPYQLAQKELGQKEISGPKDNERIVYYHSFTTLKATDDETPWCSSFMCAMAELAGFRSTRSARAKSWEDYGVPGTGLVGDIAVFSRSGGGGHVAFVNKEYKDGDPLISCLGGNQLNSVCVHNYAHINLICFRRFK